MAVVSGEAQSLEGCLVEIRPEGGAAAKVIDGAGQSVGEEVNLDGQHAVCVARLVEDDAYVIETFDGVRASVPWSWCSRWTPPLPEHGGFDLVLPSDPNMMVDIRADVSDVLAQKGFCVVQTCTSEGDRKQAVADVRSLGLDFSRMAQELEVGYMGYDNITKFATLDVLADSDEEPHQSLGGCLRNLEAVGFSAQPGSAMDLTASTMVRMPIDKVETDDFFADSLAMAEDTEKRDLALTSYVKFMSGPRTSVLYMVDNEGGHVWLYPRGQTDVDFLRIPISANKMLIFRHDLMEYSYQQQGQGLLLQKWSVQDVVLPSCNNLLVNYSEPGKLGDVTMNPGLSINSGPQASILSLATCYQGCVEHATEYWNMFVAGTDCITRHPSLRWECDTYYEEGTNSGTTGLSYTCHGGFLDGSLHQISTLDTQFWGISDKDAAPMLPTQKLCLLTGWQALQQAGFDKASVKGREIGVWCGDGGPDWGSGQDKWGAYHPEVPLPEAALMSNAVTSGRLAYLLGLKGPVSSYDTACSASLVAMNAAHLMMFSNAEDKPSDFPEALVSGVNTLLFPYSFIGNCQATMLSHQGRCFTFNRAADGYQRGEGCGSIFMRDVNRTTAKDTEVAILIGTATNQDGRSASLTAPNGPAQASMIKKSMAFAGINPNFVTIAECHGTGTALGDPIEVGAVNSVMSKRDFPLNMGSAKSNIAHLETGAGLAGIAKCIIMGNAGTAPPSNHINVLNGNLSTEGFPVIFDTEAVHSGRSAVFCGVSSFGFGGTNSRADVMCKPIITHVREVCVSLPPISYPRLLPMGQPVFISGTWNGWAAKEQMDGGRDGVYTCFVVLGSTRVERFILHCGQQTIHPLVPDADQDCQVVGPDGDGQGLYFRIDGQRDQARPGAKYKIEFTWTEDEKTISWKSRRTLSWEEPGETVSQQEQHETAEAPREEHSFSLHCSWKRWTGFQELVHDGHGTYQASFSVGPSGREEFQIACDKDETMMLYPAVTVSTTDGIASADVPICGPDSHSTSGSGSRKTWTVKAPMHTRIDVRMTLLDGHFSLSVASAATSSVSTWSSRGALGEAEHV